jgi:TonB family protein
MKRFFRALLVISLASCFGGASIARTKTTSKRPAQKKISEPAKSSSAIPCPKQGSKIILAKASEIDKPLEIISKPIAAWTPEASRAANLQGVVRLRVTFLDCGKIGAVQPVSRLPYGLTESAVEAARKMRFKPAMKNGKPVTVARVLEYPFTLY